MNIEIGRCDRNVEGRHRHRGARRGDARHILRRARPPVKDLAGQVGGRNRHLLPVRVGRPAAAAIGNGQRVESVSVSCGDDNVGRRHRHDRTRGGDARHILRVACPPVKGFAGQIGGCNRHLLSVRVQRSAAAATIDRKLINTHTCKGVCLCQRCERRTSFGQIIRISRTGVIRRLVPVAIETANDVELQVATQQLDRQRHFIQLAIPLAIAYAGAGHRQVGPGIVRRRQTEPPEITGDCPRQGGRRIRIHVTHRTAENAVATHIGRNRKGDRHVRRRSGDTDVVDDGESIVRHDTGVDRPRTTHPQLDRLTVIQRLAIPGEIVRRGCI